VNVLVTEARDVVGGNVISRKQDGFQWEEGPNTFQPTRQIMRLAVDLGLKDQLVFADHTLPRMVYWDSKLFPLPAALEDAPFFALLNPLEKLRAGLGAIGLLAGRPEGVEESVKDFIERTLGEAVFKKIIDPFVSGVYAGDPSKLSMASAFRKIYSLEDLAPLRGLIWGGLIRQMERAREARETFDPELPTYVGGALGSFREGLQQLPNTVLARLGAERVRTGWKVESLSRNADGTYTARYSTPGGERRVVARTVAITAPAQATHEVLKELVPETRRLLEVDYPCVYSVTLAYPADAFADGTRREREGLGRRLFGFGNLIPRSMGIRTLGTIWSSSLFPYRVPDGYEMVLSYIGGAQVPPSPSPPNTPPSPRAHMQARCSPGPSRVRQGSVSRPLISLLPSSSLFTLLSPIAPTLPHPSFPSLPFPTLCKSLPHAVREPPARSRHGRAELPAARRLPAMPLRGLGPDLPSPHPPTPPRRTPCATRRPLRSSRTRRWRRWCTGTCRASSSSPARRSRGCWASASGRAPSRSTTRATPTSAGRWTRAWRAARACSWGGTTCRAWPLATASRCARAEREGGGVRGSEREREREGGKWGVTPHTGARVHRHTAVPGRACGLGRRPWEEALLPFTVPPSLPPYPSPSPSLSLSLSPLPPLTRNPTQASKPSPPPPS
jgi:oxygen-dependent protoporphyrinogen oxidase